MNVPPTILGFVVVVIRGVVLGRLRRGYLKQASEKVSIEASKEIILRYAAWYYVGLAHSEIILAFLRQAAAANK